MSRASENWKAKRESWLTRPKVVAGVRSIRYTNPLKTNTEKSWSGRRFLLGRFSLRGFWFLLKSLVSGGNILQKEKGKMDEFELEFNLPGDLGYNGRKYFQRYRGKIE